MKKTKILVYTDRWGIGGIESFIMNVYKNINSEKFHIDILVAQDETDIYDKDIKEKGGTKESILEKEFQSPILRNIKNIGKFKNKLIQNQYDVIHINIGNGVGLIYAYLAKKVGIPKIIVHSHNSNVGKKNRVVKIMAHELCKRIFQDVPTNYLACSDVAAEWLYTNKILKNNKVTIINNAIEIDNYRYDEEKRKAFRKENKLEKDLVIGHIGRFNEQKNHKFLIEVFQKVLEIKGDSYLLLVGEGELEEEIKRYVKENKIEDKVIFYGRTTEIQKCLSGIDVFVLTSIYEGNPVVGIEAQAAGLSCVFSNTITSKAKITDNVIFLSLKEEKENWAKEIIKLGQNKRQSKIESIIEAGYDINTLIRNMEQVYSNNKNGEVK